MVMETIKPVRHHDQHHQWKRSHIAIFLAASAAVAIILIANEEGSATEVTRASSIGCIFFGDCKIKEETNAEARWSKEKNEEDMMIPCALKTGPAISLILLRNNDGKGRAMMRKGRAMMKSSNLHKELRRIMAYSCQ